MPISQSLAPAHSDPKKNRAWLKAQAFAIHEALERRRSRRQLGALSARDLLDIGVSRADVEEEMRKFFWRK